MDNILIDTVPADTLEVGDNIDAFGNGEVWQIVSIDDSEGFIIITLEEGTMVEDNEVIASPDERFDVYGPAVVTI
jgi:hypothetical protein